MRNLNKTKLFLDMEFTGLHQRTTPISIGMVSVDGHYFYAEFSDYDRGQVDDWIQKNVITHLLFKEPGEGKFEHYSAMRHKDNLGGNDLYESYNLTMRGTWALVVIELNRWLWQFKDVEIWSDVLAYDWVLFCEFFGGARNLPENIFYLPGDISTLLEAADFDPDISREEFAGNLVEVFDTANWGVGKKHNALWDACVIRQCYKRLCAYFPGLSF